MSDSLFSDLQKELEQLIDAGEAPRWLTVRGLVTLKDGYLGPQETPRDMWLRVAKAAAKPYMEYQAEGNTNEPLPLYWFNWEKRFFELLWKGWLGAATPILSNLGTDKGFPISCFAVYVGDSRESIFNAFKEVSWLAAKGGGTAVHVSDIRGTGEPIGRGGKSSGVVSWLRVFDVIASVVTQGGYRRGSNAAYLDITHKDFKYFLKMRKAVGDSSLQCLNLHHGVNIPDDFMKRLKEGGVKERELWTDYMSVVDQLGEPYAFFIDNVNKANPDCYKDRGLDVKGSNLCSEITLHTSEEYTLVCCLSSLNLEKYDEWKQDEYVVRDSIYFLDAVMSEFIEKASKEPAFSKAVDFAKKSRALGLGVMGYHSLLQKRGYAFKSDEARLLNEEIFSYIQEQARGASRQLAFEFEEPEWCRGYGVRNTHLTAVAPTKSNSAICNTSEGIEPLQSNYFIETAKGNYLRKNKYLIKLLKEKGLNTKEVWDSIRDHRGSVQHLEGLTAAEKEVFLTFKEIEQEEIIRQASTRQQYIDQSQSLNLCPDPEKTNLQSLSKLYVLAWSKGLKSIYYLKREALLSASSAVDIKEDLEDKSDLESKVDLDIEEVDNEAVEDKFCTLGGEGCSSCEG